MKSVPILGHTDSPWSVSNHHKPPTPLQQQDTRWGCEMDRLYYKKKEIKKKCAACQAKYLAFQDIV